jgi:hypothetical protein
VHSAAHLQQFASKVESKSVKGSGLGSAQQDCFAFEGLLLASTSSTKAQGCSVDSLAPVVVDHCSP